MPKILILCHNTTEVEIVRNACSFLPGKELQIEILNEHQKDKESQTQITFFASLAAFETYSTIHPSPTLFLHKDLAILQITDDYIPPKSFYDNGLRLCCLSNDLNRDLSVTLPNLQFYKDYAHFEQSKQPSDVLLTNNMNLILSLLMQDTCAWEMIHPDLNARNLAIDLFGDTLILPRIKAALNALEGKADSAMDCYNFPALLHSNKASQTSYSFFAEQYDDYMAHVDYDFWVTRLLAWYQAYAKNPLKHILELACGTANISSRLVLKSYDVDACDLSYDMLRVASRKSLKPNLYHASLTDPIPNQGYQLVVCMFDSVNYLTKSKDISKMLGEVSSALAEGGLYIFDISTLYNSEENFADICSMQRSNDGYLVHQAWFENIQLKQKSGLHYFSKNHISYQHKYEEHTQRVYYCSELVELISSSPLKLIAVHTTETKTNYYPRHLSNIDSRFPRLFFILKKEQI